MRFLIKIMCKMLIVFLITKVTTGFSTGGVSALGSTSKDQIQNEDQEIAEPSLAESRREVLIKSVELQAVKDEYIRRCEEDDSGDNQAHFKESLREKSFLSDQEKAFVLSLYKNYRKKFRTDFEYISCSESMD